VGERNKQIIEGSDGPWVNLYGDAGGISVNVYCSELPPSCRLEKWIEKIPKTQTVEAGGFIEVERLKVVCGNGNGGAE
jgi:hypothetical protein